MLEAHFGDEDAKRILRQHPADKLLFATDWPWLGFADGLRYVRSMGLSPETERAILGGNAAALLGVTVPAPW